jgi:hypothetical protein
MLHLPRRSGKSADAIGSVAGLGSVPAAGGIAADGCMPGVLGFMSDGLAGVVGVPLGVGSFFDGSVDGVCEDGVITPEGMAGAAAPAVT